MSLSQFIAKKWNESQKGGFNNEKSYEKIPVRFDFGIITPKTNLIPHKKFENIKYICGLDCFEIGL